MGENYFKKMLCHISSIDEELALSVGSEFGQIKAENEKLKTENEKLRIKNKELKSCNESNRRSILIYQDAITNIQKNISGFGEEGLIKYQVYIDKKRNEEIKKGNKATDWTPAPEDMDKKISAT